MRFYTHPSSPTIYERHLAGGPPAHRLFRCWNRRWNRTAPTACGRAGPQPGSVAVAVTATGSATPLSHSVGRAFYLGRNTNENGGRSFPGALDDFRVYDGWVGSAGCAALYTDTCNGSARETGRHVRLGAPPGRASASLVARGRRLPLAPAHLASATVVCRGGPHGRMLRDELCRRRAS